MSNEYTFTVQVVLWIFARTTREETHEKLISLLLR